MFFETVSKLGRFGKVSNSRGRIRAFSVLVWHHGWTKISEGQIHGTLFSLLLYGGSGGGIMTQLSDTLRTSHSLGLASSRTKCQSMLQGRTEGRRGYSGTRDSGMRSLFNGLHYLRVALKLTLMGLREVIRGWPEEAG